MPRPTLPAPRVSLFRAYDSSGQVRDGHDLRLAARYSQSVMSKSGARSQYDLDARRLPSDGGTVAVSEPPSSRIGGPEIAVPRFSEYRATAADAAATPVPVRPTKPPPKGRFLAALVLGGLCATLGYGIWDAFFRHWAYGIVEGHEVEVLPPWSGLVEQLHVCDGDHVAPGQLLVTLDSPDLRHRIARCEDELRIARAALTAEEARLSWQERVDADRRGKAVAEYHEARGNLLHERAELDLATRRLARAKTLAEAHTITDESMETATFAELGQREKVAQLAAAVEQLQRRAEETAAVAPDERTGGRRAALQSRPIVASPAGPRELTHRDESENLGATPAMLEPHLLRIEACEAELARCREELGRGGVRATVGGIVVRRESLPGDQVHPGQSLLTLLEDESAVIAIYLPQDAARALAVDQQVRVHVAPWNGTMPFRVERIGQQYRAAPAPISRRFRAEEQLLPVYLRPIGGTENKLAACLGGVATLPRFGVALAGFGESRHEAAAASSDGTPRLVNHVASPLPESQQE